MESTPAADSKIKNTLYLVWHFISTFLVTLVVIAALALVAVKVSGCYLFNIESSSMSPSYPVNTLVVVKPVDFDEIEEGDVITYILNQQGTLVTHRVISINTTDEAFVTQGDANTSADTKAVYYENVVGKVIFKVPGVGGFVSYISDEDNRPLVIGIIAALFILSLASDIVKRLVRRRQNKRLTAETPAEAITEKEVCADETDSDQLIKE